MSSYLSKAYQKFRQDAPSKLIYDVLKGAGAFVLGGLVTILLPDKYAFKKWLLSESCQSIYTLIIVIVSAALSAVVLMLIIARQRIRKLSYDADRDELTGLKNGTAFRQNLAKKVVEAQKGLISLSLIILDIDDFKQFNDRHEYKVASEVIKKVGDILATDKRATDELFRQFQKGDEFLIVAVKTNLVEARRAAERKRELIAQTNLEINGKVEKVTVSCGIAELSKESDTMELLIARATKALKLAKEKGKNCTEAIA